MEVSKLFPNTDDGKSDFAIENHNVAKITVGINLNGFINEL